MRQKFNKLMTISLVTSVVVVLVGLMLIFFANNMKISLETAAYIFAILLILNGISSIIDDYKQFKIFFFFDGFTSGLLSMILGIVILSNPNIINVLLPIVVGVWFIINATFKLRMSLALRDTKNKQWMPTYLLSLLTIITGLCLIFNPEIGGLSVLTFIGILAVVYGICDIISVVLFKKNIKAIAKVFE